MIKTFYYFPFKRIPAVLYTADADLQSKIFQVFYHKLGSKHWFFVNRLKKGYFRALCELCNKENIQIPDQDVQFIYRGYEKNLFFCVSKENTAKIKRLYIQKNDHFDEIPFQGYPVFFDINSEKITNKKDIQDFLQKHWEELKEGKGLHGDFTHLNLLINDKKEVHAIDQKSNIDNSLISDHCYFYCYLLWYIAKHKGNVHNFKKDLDQMFFNIFDHEDAQFLLKLIDKIDTTQFPQKNAQIYISTFKDLFSSSRNLKENKDE